MTEAYLALRLYSAFILYILFSASFMKQDRRRSDNALLLILLAAACLMLCGAFYYAFILWNIPRGYKAANFLNTILFYAVITGFTVYLDLYISERSDEGNTRFFSGYIVAASVCGAAGFLFWALAPWFTQLGETGMITNTALYWAGQMPGLLIVATDIVLIIRSRKRLSGGRAAALLSLAVLPVAGIILELVLSLKELRYCGITLSLILVYTLVHTNLVDRITEQLNRNRIELMESQIRPHFLFNCLNSIYYLCGKDADKADEALTQFADYLSCNVDAINHSRLVPFAQELEHIRHYLALEKLRFGEELEVQWDIREENFRIPLLSVQPIVENAVKHGLFKKRDGGVIRIESLKINNHYRIRVDDDGVGFDPERYREDGRPHVGIDNVRRRLETESGATLTIRSRVGYGTTAEILIPVRKTGRISSGG